MINTIYGEVVNWETKRDRDTDEIGVKITIEAKVSSGHVLLHGPPRMADIIKAVLGKLDSKTSLR